MDRTPPRTRESASANPGRRALWLAVAVASFAAAQAGVALVGGDSRAGIILPLVAAVGLGMAWLALARFEFFVVAILAVRASLDAAKLNLGTRAGLDPAGLLSILFLVAGIVWLLAQAQESEAPRSRLVRPLVAVTFAGLLSVAFSQNPLAAGVDVVRLATVVVIVAVLHRLLLDPHRIALVMGAVFASAVVPLVVAVYQAVGGHHLLVTGSFSMTGSFTRVQSTFTHPNPFSMYLTLLIVTGVAIVPHLKRGPRLAVLALVGASGVFLLLTYTRGAWIATLVGLVVVGVLQSKRLLLSLLVGCIALVLVFPSTLTRFKDLGEETRDSGAPANSLVWRLQYWNQALELSNNPLFGVGLNTIQASTSVEKQPHNDFIRIYVETGLVGLAAYIWLLGALITVAHRAVARALSGVNRGIAVGFAGVLVAFLVLSAVSNVITQLVILWYFATLAAAAAAVARPSMDSELLRILYAPAREPP